MNPSTRSHSLSELLENLDGYEPSGQLPETLISGISFDSRRVQPGDLFVALSGGSTDGHRYIPQAVQAGAAAIVGTQMVEGLSQPYVQVADSRRALAYLSAAFYSFPARQLTVIGVTGTDGKTTTASLIYKILQAAGHPSGMITTVSALIGEREFDTGFHVTTPEAPFVQGYLAEMVSAGLTHVVLEATSHGLSQQRVAACDFDVAVVTNITHEHLDYHGTYPAYRAAKAQLFAELARTAPKSRGNPRLAVLNKQDSSYDFLAEYVDQLDAPIRRIDYGLEADAEIRATNLANLPSGIRFLAEGAGYRLPVESHLIGAYNVFNCLAAIAATVDGLGLPPQAAAQGIAGLSGIPGRMETIDLGQEFIAIVDFAHTPNALRRALEASRELVEGRVIAVFGSAGLRDRAKRRMMAEVAADLADITVLTAEDPRTESLGQILAQMAGGAEGRGGIEGETFWQVPDRGAAIRFALELAQPGDLVLVCGKGHEQSMCFGETEYPWDDRQALRAALADYLNIPGPAMPYLPTQDVGSGDG